MNCYELEHTAKLTAVLLLLQIVIHIIMFSINSYRMDLRVEQLTRIEGLLEDIRFNGEDVYDEEEEEEEAEEAEEEAEEAEEEEAEAEAEEAKGTERVETAENSKKDQ
jgi:hypothetical protein